MRPPSPAQDLDAVSAAPRHHLRLLENPHIRVLETKIAPGETVPLHTHAWPAVHYFLSTGDIVRRNAEGVIEYDSRQSPAPSAGQALWSPPLAPHSLENVGTTTVHVISVEVKGT